MSSSSQAKLNPANCWHQASGRHRSEQPEYVFISLKAHSDHHVYSKAQDRITHSGASGPDAAAQNVHGRHGGGTAPGARSTTPYTKVLPKHVRGNIPASM
jgi:hypothetical protein